MICDSFHRETFMKHLVLILFAFITVASYGQNANAMLRQQTFGVYSSIADLQAVKPDTNTIAVFGNGFALTREELETVYTVIGGDSSAFTKKEMADEMIASYQRCFEAMDQNLDTSVTFQIDFLQYKQSIITPYLNEGKTRTEAEALPEVKYVLRLYYVDKMEMKLKAKEIWSQSPDSKLREYFAAHPEKYQGQPYEISRTKVIYDYQKELETAMMTRVTAKFPVQKNTDLISRI